MRWKSVALLGAAWAASGCELREITLAPPEDIVVAEVILRPHASVQKAYLHRTSTGHGGARVLGAHIRITEEETGRSFDMDVAPDGECLDPPPPVPDAPDLGTCYAAQLPDAVVLPGRTYSVRIQLADGGVLTGSTRVPDMFELRQPSAWPCVVPADTQFELIWTGSPGTSVYLVEAHFSNLREALRARGVDVPGVGSVELLGLSVTAEDTTLLVPAELGLFDRFDDDLYALLIALRQGLPPGVSTTLSVSAAERNYVNWIRGGNFNPSGRVRVSSLRGDGAGVFGAVVTRIIAISTDPEGEPSGFPRCDGAGAERTLQSFSSDAERSRRD